MSLLFADITCASLPREALPALAALRAASDVTVALVGPRAWVRWRGTDDAVPRQLLPVPGVELFTERDGRWFRWGRHLPAFDVPVRAEYRPLAHVLFPAEVQPSVAFGPALRPVSLRLVRDHEPRPVTALRCALAELCRWAESTPTIRLAHIRAARHGELVLALGSRLPLLADAQRFWGQRLLIPVGQRAEPALPEEALLEALGVGPEELAVWDEEGIEALPQAVFDPLTRAGLRRAGREGA